MGCFTGQPSWKDNRTSNMATDNNNNNSGNNNKRDSLNSGGTDDTRRTSDFRLLPKNLLRRLKKLGGDHTQTLNKITTFGSRAGDGESSQPLALYHTCF